MWCKAYGKTGKQVSVIGFGGMRFPKPEDIDGSADIVRYAHSRGINYFDTAPYYCNDKSEDIMGQAFKAMPRDSFFCSTKCGEASGDELRRSLDRSLKRLGVDYIDFFHIWCLVRPEQLQERIKGGAIPALMKAKEEGLVRHAVASAHLNGMDLVGVLESGYFEGLTIGYNALNFPFRSEALEAAGKMGAGIVTMNPLSGGVIPRNAERLAFLKGPADRSVSEAAIRFNASHSAISVVLVGLSSREQVDEAVAAVDNFKPYGQDHIKKLQEQVRAGFNGFCTGCGYCLPCPAGVAIPKFMDAHNHKILEGSDQSVLNRLKWHWSLAPDEAAKCTQCGRCEAQCTQHLPIRDRLKHIAGLKKE